MVVDRAHRLVQMVLVQVAGRDDLAILDVEKLLGVSRPLHAPAHHPEGDAPGRGILSQHAAGDDGGHGNRGGRGGEKLAAADAGG